MTSLAKAWALNVVMFRLLGRDRTALFLIVVLPFLIILVVGSVTGSDEPIRVAVVVEEDGDLAADVVSRLEGTGVLDVERAGSAEAATRAVRGGRLAAALIVPASYAEDAVAGRSSGFELLAPLDRPTSAVVRSTVAAVLQEASSRLAAAQAIGPGPLADRLTTVDHAAETVAGPAVVARAVGRGEGGDGNPFSHTAPANLVLFVFITSLASSASMIELRQRGILRRMMASPTSVGTVVLGSALTRMVLVLGQAALILVVGGVAFGVHWGDPVGAVAVVLVFAIVAVGAGIVISTLFRSAEQAGAVAPPLGIALGMLGGCMWPLDIVGPLMRTVGHVTPQAWAMDAWEKLVAERAGVDSILKELAVLAAFAVVLFGVGVIRLRKELVAGR